MPTRRLTITVRIRRRSRIPERPDLLRRRRRYQPCQLRGYSPAASRIRTTTAALPHGGNDGPLQGRSIPWRQSGLCFPWTCLPPGARLTPPTTIYRARLCRLHHEHHQLGTALRLQTGLRLEATHEYGLGNMVNPAAGPNGDGMDNNGNWIGTTRLRIPRTISILCPASRPAMPLRPRRPSARSMRAASPGQTSTTWCRTFRPPAITPWWPPSATLANCPPMPTTTICFWNRN
jgi:hypothetical protein